MNIIFEWDRERLDLKRTPESPVSSREEQMRAATLIRDLQGADAVARETAKYQLALDAYEAREWFQPIRGVVGGSGPAFVHADKPPPKMYDEMRDSLRKLSMLQGDPLKLARLVAEQPELQDAVNLNEYAFRVSKCEGYNETCCRALLMAHAWLVELNPQGDAAAIDLLRGLLRNWFRIDDPHIGASERHIQASKAAHNYHWLSDAWRRVWGKP